MMVERFECRRTVHEVSGIKWFKKCWLIERRITHLACGGKAESTVRLSKQRNREVFTAYIGNLQRETRLTAIGHEVSNPRHNPDFRIRPCDNIQLKIAMTVTQGKAASRFHDSSMSVDFETRSSINSFEAYFSNLWKGGEEL